jgi:nitrogen fixation protein NifU and related proteins
MYSKEVLDHFEHPRNAGVVAEPDAQALIENPACGDTLRVTVKIVDGQIEEIRFQAKGCVASIGCASAMTELVRGKTVEEARGLRRVEIVEAVGGLPQASIHASHLAIDALGAVLGQLGERARGHSA